MKKSAAQHAPTGEGGWKTAGVSKRITKITKRAKVGGLKRSKLGGYEVAGEAVDGTRILAPKVPSKRFSVEDVQKALRGLRLGLGQLTVQDGPTFVRGLENPPASSGKDVIVVSDKISSRAAPGGFELGTLRKKPRR